MGMKPRHQVSKAAVELIKKFEGYRSKAAQLPDGRWTIGFGHTLTAREGAQVSEQDAEALLLYDLIAVAHAVNEQTFTPLTQNQFDALCCFAFNVGVDNFKRSSVLRRVNEGSLLQAACAMEMWRKADFEGERIVVDALVRRRSAEKTLFLTPAGGWVPAPSPIVRPKVDYDAVNAIPRQTPTALKAPMTGEKAVVEREQPRADSGAGVIPLASSAVLSAADLVGAKLAQIVPEPTPEPAPQAAPEPAVAQPVAAEPVAAMAIEESMIAPEPVVEVVEPVASQTADESLAWSPSTAPLEGVVEGPDADEDDQGDAYSDRDDPVLEIVRTAATPTPVPAADALAFPPPPAPVEALPEQPASYTPFPAAPALAVAGDRAFVLTPAPEQEPAPTAAEQQRDPFKFEAANESEPGLFDISSQPFEPEMAPVRSQGLLSEDHIRRLVEEDERVLAANFDPDMDGAPLEEARIVGLPWIIGGVVGAAVCGGGVAWGYFDDTGNLVSTAVAWGLGITGGGVMLFSAWRWLESLGMPRLEDEEEDRAAE